MILAGFQKTSLVDWPGQICATIFIAGCNFRCPFCHNPELVLPDLIETLDEIEQDEIILELHKRKNLIDLYVGQAVEGEETLPHASERLFKEILDVASALKRTKFEQGTYMEPLLIQIDGPSL